jgi:hypothetical protein
MKALLDKISHKIHQQQKDRTTIFRLKKKIHTKVSSAFILPALNLNANHRYPHYLTKV